MDPSQVAIIESLRVLVRDASKSRFQHLRSDAAHIVELTSDEAYSPVADHWMAVILLASNKFKLLFKIHFDTTKAARVGEKKSHERSVAYQETNLRDFDQLKEYCNLVGGAIKQALGEEHSSAGLSLPLALRGFDELFFRDRVISSKGTRFHDAWRVESQGFTITCSSDIRVMAWDAFTTVNYEVTQASDEGDMEFL